MFKTLSRLFVRNAYGVLLATMVSTPLSASLSIDVASTTVAPNTNSIPSISGVMRTFSSNAPDVFVESWVVLSPHGMRVTDGVSKSEIIKNFTEQRLWLQDRKAKIQHEINLKALETDFPELAPALMGTGSESNIFGNKPCDTWSGIHEGERIWRGMVVEVWGCEEESGMVVNRQYFSQQYSIVVRVEHPNSIVEELRNISDLQTQSSDFQPDKEFNLVSYTEFTSGESPLTPYSEN